jgi:hypothetical protein
LWWKAMYGNSFHTIWMATCLPQPFCCNHF